MNNETKCSGWKISETARYDYCAHLETAKGKASILGNCTTCFEINISLQIIINGIETGKYAHLSTKELQDHEHARQWAESLLR
jgi:hypothetical protein